MVGTTLSHYKVLEKIGQGGMGEVDRAVELTVSDDRQGMGDLSYLEAVLLDALRVGVVHEPPAPDELHTRACAFRSRVKSGAFAFGG